MKEDEECQMAQEEFKTLKSKFVSLSKRYEDLQDEVHAQAIKTNALMQKVADPYMNKMGLVPPPPDR